MMKKFFSQHRLSISVLGGFIVLFLAITLANAILGLGPGNIVVLEFGAFAIIIGLLWILGQKNKGKTS